MKRILNSDDGPSVQITSSMPCIAASKSYSLPPFNAFAWLGLDADKTLLQQSWHAPDMYTGNLCNGV